LKAVERVGASGWYILGSEVAAFEEALAEQCRVRHVIGCASGLDAIELALRAAGLPRGGQVLTTPLSAFATTLAIVRAGGVPVFVDVDASGLLDLDRAEEVLREHPEIRFMVPVHLYGHALDLERLDALRARYGLTVVEDCAQAVGATSGGRAVGSAGTAGTLSFYPTKNLGALGDGGAVLTQDDRIATRCRNLRDYGQERRYSHTALGLNSRLDEVHAAVLRSVFLPRLGDWTSRRRQIASRYLERLPWSAQLERLPVPERSQSVWHLFPVRAADDRDGMLSHLRQRGIQGAVHYPAIIPEQPALKDPLVFGTLERARHLAATEVSLPIHPALSDAEIDEVVSAVREWCSEAAKRAAGGA